MELLCKIKRTGEMAHKHSAICVGQWASLKELLRNVLVSEATSHFEADTHEGMPTNWGRGHRLHVDNTLRVSVPVT